MLGGVSGYIHNVNDLRFVREVSHVPIREVKFLADPIPGGNGDGPFPFSLHLRRWACVYEIADSPGRLAYPNHFVRTGTRVSACRIQLRAPWDWMSEREVRVLAFDEALVLDVQTLNTPS